MKEDVMPKANVIVGYNKTFEVDVLKTFEYKGELFFVHNIINYLSGGKNKNKFIVAHFKTGLWVANLFYYLNCKTILGAQRIAKKLMNNIGEVSFHNRIKKAYDKNGIINGR